MGGCTNCTGKTGCDDRKGNMLAEVADWLERLYPTREWGVMDDELAMLSGVQEDDAIALAEELAGELEAATIYRAGGDEDLCDFIYVMCVGREPCVLQMRDVGVALPDELDPESVISEQYLRIALSSVAPFAVVQQVAVTMTCVDGSWIVREEVRPGVYDAPLLRRFQRLVALLPAYGITHIDMGEISEPPTAFAHGAYPGLFGTEPHQVNYLFYRQPSTMIVTTTL